MSYESTATCRGSRRIEIVRAVAVLCAVLLASCGGEDAKESRIIGRWKTGAVASSSNSVYLNLNHEENEIDGHADVNGGVYDLEGSWEGSLGPDETVDLELSVVVRGMSISGTGTLNTAGEEYDMTVAGRRRGMGFDMSLSPESGQAMRVSGQIGYGPTDFKLRVSVENIPADIVDGAPRELQLNVSGTRRGGELDLF